MNGGDFAVLALSCDKYADLWPGFLQQFRRYFPPGYPIYLGSNRVRCADPGVTPLLSGSDPDWSTSLRRILEQIPERKVFVILEDLYLASPVDRSRFEAALRFLFDRDARHVKYWGNPPPDEPTDDPSVGLYARGAPYRATVCGFWDRDFLKGLLIDGENPWNFEILGSYRASYADGFYGLHSTLCEYRNMIEKGRWIAESVQWAQSEGVPMELAKRPLLQRGNRFVSRAKMAYFDLMLKVPWRWRVAVMDKLRRALISY